MFTADDGWGDRIAGDSRGFLLLWRGEERRHGGRAVEFEQVRIRGLFEGCEDRVPAAFAGAEGAGFQDRLVGVGVGGDAFALKEREGSGVTVGFVEFVFLVEGEGITRVAFGGCEDEGRHVARLGGGGDDEGDVARREGGRQFGETLEPEVDAGGRVVVGLPLGGRKDEEGDDAAGRLAGGVVEGGVVVDAKVRAKPDEGAHEGALGWLERTAGWCGGRFREKRGGRFATCEVIGRNTWV